MDKSLNKNAGPDLMSLGCRRNVVSDGASGYVGEWVIGGDLKVLGCRW